MSDGLNVGTVKGTVELEDRMSSAIDLLEHKIESLDKTFGGLGHHFVETASSFFTAEAALDAVKEAAHLVAETLKEITIEGSHAADIENTFEHLTEGAGQVGDVLLGKVREGLHGTVTDMEIMTRVNDNMVAGLKLSDEQWTNLSNGAFTLAKAKGLETKDVLDKISDAMLTGRVRTLALVTGKIDLAAAEEKYAATLGTTADHLSAEGKLSAAQAAIMDKVASATENAGEVHVRLADKIKQVQVSVANFEEELGTAVATSPVVAAGFDGIRDAIGSAFGGTQEEMIQKIAHVVDDVAISVLGFAENAVDAIGVIGVEWNAGIVVFESVKAGWAAIAYVADGALLLIAKGINAISFGALDDQVKGIEDEMEGWYNTMAESQASIDNHKKAEDEWAVSTGKVKDVIEGVRQKMISAKESEGEFTDVIRDNKTTHEAAAEAAGHHGEAESKLGLTITLSKEELKAYNEAWANLNTIQSNYKATLAELPSELAALVTDYASWGAKVDDLVKAFPGLTKAQAEAAVASQKAARDIQKVYADTFDIIAKSHGDNINDWIAGERRKLEATLAALQAEGKLTEEASAAELAKFNATVDAEIAKRASQVQGSRAMRQTEYDDAKNLLELMIKDSADFSDDEIRQQRLVTAEKFRNLNNWRAADHDALQAHADETEKIYEAEIARIEKLNNAFRDLHQEMSGGAYEVTSQNFEASIKSIQTSGGWNPSGTGSNVSLSQAYQWAQLGYSMGEITRMFALLQQGANGPLPPPQGPRIPGFRNGGIGDFGEGTLAMLHGREAIIPLDQSTHMGGDTNVFYVNGTAEETARKVGDIMMERSKRRRYYGAA